MLTKNVRRIISLLIMFILLLSFMPQTIQVSYADDIDGETQNEEKTETYPVIIEVGAEHAGFVDNILAGMEEDGYSATAEGSTITVEFPAEIRHYENVSDKEGTLKDSTLADAQGWLGITIMLSFEDEDNTMQDNGKIYGGLGQKLTGYKDWYEVISETEDETSPKLKDVTEVPTLYVLWAEPVSEVEITVEPLVDGTEVKSEKVEGYYDYYVQSPQPKVTVLTDHMYVDYYEDTDPKEEYAYWRNQGEDYVYDEILNGTVKAGETYIAYMYIVGEFGYMVSRIDTKIILNGEELDEDYYGVIYTVPLAVYAPITVVDSNKEQEHEHEWTDWYTVKQPTEAEEGLQERICTIDPSHKETRTIPKLTSVGISVEPDHVEWTAEEGYKGSTDAGLEEDAVQQTVTITSTGSEEVEFIMAGFKDSSSYEHFSVSAGGMEITVSPKEGLAPGTYTATVVISDWDDRFEPLEIPVTFTVTSKDNGKDDNKDSGSGDSNPSDGGPKSNNTSNSGNSSSNSSSSGSKSTSGNESGSSSTSGTNVPKTGDDMNLMFYMVILWGSLIASYVVKQMRHKKRLD